MIKRRLEKKTSSSRSTPIPSSPTPSPHLKNGDDDKPVAAKIQLLELIRQSTGHAPDRRLYREITEGLELRQIPLEEYLEDIRPRLKRLKQRPRPGFFLHHMTNWIDAQPTEELSLSANPSNSRCPSCSGIGRTADGYCNCALGRDLARVESPATMSARGAALHRDQAR